MVFRSFSDGGWLRPEQSSLFGLQPGPGRVFHQVSAEELVGSRSLAGERLSCQTKARILAALRTHAGESSD